MGNIFKIQRFSLHDGPGIRTTVFFKGCPLRCGWCCNPESQHARHEVFFYDRLCTGCNACLAVCPAGAINSVNRVIDRALCTACGTCAAACLLGAKELAGRDMSVKDIMAVVRRDTVFYRNSNGGVTLCGGEPLAQKGFAVSLLDALRDEGIHSAMETSACVNGPGVPGLVDMARHCDLVLFDLKTVNVRKGRDVLGLDVDAAIEALRGMLAADVQVTLRYAVIPGFNDSETDKQAFVDLARSLPVRNVNLLPFHRLGDGKYTALGRQYDYADCMTMNRNDLEELCRQFVNAGVDASVEA